MRFSPAYLDELRTRLPVSRVVGRKVRLKKEGREWRGLSPFTHEKTPSFFVNDQKGRWFDFSAGRNGDIVSFVMESEGLGFTEAVEKLAGEAGLALPAVSREDVARETQRKTALDAMEAAADFFEANLRSRAGDAARAYLDGRGIGDDVRREFRIGVATRERFALRDHLATKGFTRDTMIEGGLLIHGEDIEVPYDRFRDRIMFPIQDRSGRVIAFGGRALDPTASAKYLNSPETSLFHKGGGLYNHHRARKAAQDTGRVIVVEGYVDVIAMAQAGFPEAVAPLGTALTQDQCALLWGMSVEPILCFDGDKAGQKAAGRAIELALPLLAATRTLRFALLPEGRDPDDLLRSGGPDAVQAIVSGALPLVEALWLRERDARPLDTPEHRADLLRRLTERAEAIGDRELRRAYQSDLRGRAFDRFRELRPARAAPAAGRPWSPDRPWGHGRETTAAPVASASLVRSAMFSTAGDLSPRLAVILAALIDFPSLIGPLAEDVAALALPDAELGMLRTCLLGLLDHDVPDRAMADAAIEAAGCRAAAERVFLRAGLLRLRPDAEGEMPLDAAFALRQALALQRRPTALHTDLRAAQADLAADLSDKNLHKLSDLRAQLSSREGLEASREDLPATTIRPIR